MSHLNSLHLQLGGAGVGAGGVDAMLVGDDLPELGPDLVAALTRLYVHYFSHGGYSGNRRNEKIYSKISRNIYIV